MARVLTRHFLRPKTPNSSPFPSSFRHKKPPLDLPHRILNAFDQCKTLTQLLQIHALHITSGYSHNPFFSAKLLNLSSQLAHLNHTLTIFHSFTFLNRVCVNAVIRAFSLSVSSLAIQGVLFYFHMLTLGFSVTSFTFPSLLRCCAVSGCGVSGLKCHGQVIKRGFDGVVEIRNSLIHMYGCIGMIDGAVGVFEGMLDRDLVSWNSMISALFGVGDARGARRMFDEMPVRNVVSWNVMMSGYLESGMPGFVLKVFRRMVKAGGMGDGTSVAVVLTGCGKSGRLREGMSVHGVLVRKEWNLNLIMYTAMIEMYSKCGKVEAARRVFDGLTERNLVCWNSMILGYCFHGNPLHGLDLFAEMVERRGEKEGAGVSPDAITFIGVLCACTRAGRLEEGRDHFYQMVDRFGVKPNFAHYWCMANLLASNGLMEEAMETVRKVNEFNDDLSSESLSWATLLALCRFQGDTLPGERVAESIIKLEPQNIMGYALLFNVYAAAGRWDDVSALKEAIRERFAGRSPGCSLLDLIEIVHKFKIGNSNDKGVEVAMSMDELFQRQNLSCFLLPNTNSLRQSFHKLLSKG